MERILITENGTTATEIVVGPAKIADPLVFESMDHDQAVIFTQPDARAHADAVAQALPPQPGGVPVVVLPDGEAAKTFAVVEDACSRLNELGLTRSSVIVAVGGGALTDVAGFIAATYLRGLTAVYVPTTLLGAVDAAIGGKTGVNVAGKNLAGIFKHPELVVVDIDVLEALPEGLRTEGTAEAVKAGFVADLDLMTLFETQGLDAPLADVVPRAIAVKAAVVSEDFRESGRRAILNYGHTVGHGIEVVTGLSHGHAIAIGMTAAAEVATRLVGFEGAARQRRILNDLGLPTDAPGADRDRVRALMDLDKKRDGLGLRMVLLEDFGRPTVRRVDDATVDLALEAIGLA